VNNRSIALSLLAIVTAVAILFSSCRKINESTELGGDLIPPVDNINTFDTILNVQAFNDTFGITTDSTVIAKNAEFWLGKINLDPLFGQTDARMFFELKPPFFKYYFLDRPDSLALDSVVLVLNYIETYGDTNTAQTVNVYEMDQSNNFRSDTAYLIRKNQFTYTNLLGSKTFFPRTLNDSVKAYKDTTTNQLRIKLSDTFGNFLLHLDSTGSNGGYVGDSVFRTKFKGFALQSMNSGNAVMGFDLTGVNTKLAIYYRYLDGGGPNSWDTTVAYWNFTGNSAAANYIKRDYAGTPVMQAVSNSPTSPDPLIFIQSTPGTFAKLKIPDLATLSNRVVHRAELIVEQFVTSPDSTFGAPDYLFLDAFDPTITNSTYKFRTIPYDLIYSSTGALNLGSFGVAPKISVNSSGFKYRTWKFNVSRYVQHVLNGTLQPYDLRLSAPYIVSDQYGIPPGQDITLPLQLNPSIVKGRIRLVGTDPSATDPQRVRLRIVYSKL
jgi:hypothetical protein